MTVLLVIVEQLYQGMFHNIQAKCAIVIVFGGVIGGCFFLHFAFCILPSSCYKKVLAQVRICA